MTKQLTKKTTKSTERPKKVQTKTRTTQINPVNSGYQRNNLSFIQFFKNNVLVEIFADENSWKGRAKHIQPIPYPTPECTQTNSWKTREHSQNWNESVCTQADVTTPTTTGSERQLLDRNSHSQTDRETKSDRETNTDGETPAGQHPPGQTVWQGQPVDSEINL